MKMSFTFLIGSILFISSTCADNEKDCHNYISIHNVSNKNIYVEYVLGYPDTTYFKYEPNPALSPELSKVLSGQTNSNALGSRSCWEDKFKSLIKSDTVMIYVFDAQVLESTPWDTVKANYLILKRYDLSLVDLQQMNWTVTYP